MATPDALCHADKIVNIFFGFDLDLSHIDLAPSNFLII